MNLSSNTTAQSEPRSFAHLIRGLVTALILSVILVAAAAALLLAMPFNESHLRPAAIAVSVISIFIGGRAAAKPGLGKAWLNGGIVGVAYFLLLFVLGIIFLADISLSPALFIMLAVGFVCGALGGVMGGNAKRGKRRR